MVEFALVAPLFFFLICTMVDGGMLLFSMNSVDNATTIGGNAIAALGKNDTTDFTAIARMARGGFGNTGLITVNEIDVDGLATGPGGAGFQIDSVTKKPKVATCGGGPCHNRYRVSVARSGDVAVTLINPTPCSITFPNGGGTPTGGPCTAAPYPPSSRNINDGTTSFVGLTVDYTYSYFTGISSPLNLVVTKTLRLEPQEPASP